MRIEQNNMFLLDVVNAIKEGKMAKAPFNRDYAWNDQDVIMLFQSIQKGYPIGNIITWSPDEEKSYEPRLGPVLLKKSPSHYIVDGHNRLATLAYSMSKPEEINDVLDEMTENELAVWGQDRSLVFNGLTKEIYFMDNEDLSTARNVIPVGFTATRDFNIFMRKNYHLLDNDDVLDEMSKMGDQIRETRLIQMSLNRASNKQAIDAFRHMAKTGQPMSEDDVQRAQKWFLNQKGPSLDMA